MEDQNMRTILIADDEESIRTLLKRVLKNRCEKVITAKDGYEALQQYQFAKDIIDLVITDYNMPTMNGQQLIQEIRQTQTRHTPIILITANTLTSQQAQNINADEILTKPFQLSTLYQTIKKYEKQTNRKD